MYQSAINQEERLIVVPTASMVLGKKTNVNTVIVFIVLLSSLVNSAMSLEP